MPGRVRGLRGDGETADAVVVVDADWSDYLVRPVEVSPKDEQGNVLSGDAWVHNSENCYINSDEKLVAAIGVENRDCQHQGRRCW
uniref:hypothetical protein n=1 Tax=Klebsiella quasipneumoniae TaxID=1463165 RepID=UPI00389070FA